MSNAHAGSSLLPKFTSICSSWLYQHSSGIYTLIHKSALEKKKVTKKEFMIKRVKFTSNYMAVGGMHPIPQWRITFISFCNKMKNHLISEGFKDTVTPKAMTIEEIKTTITSILKWCCNAVKAGFDGVEISF
jgi:N-ethylmaleimide reductase